MTKAITTEFAGVTYTAEVEGATVRIYADGVGAGQGIVEDGRIVCDAVLPDEVYDALEAQLAA